jgi:tripartite-type tricarboxylate transporter receptor subunit TctC
MKPRPLAVLAATLIAIAVVAAPCAALAQAKFPDKPVRIVVPSSPGGTLDFLARVLGPELSRMWGQPVIVDDRAGAGGIIGSQLVAQAAPDGHTLLFVATGYTINPYMYAKLPYDTLKDFAPVSLLATTATVLVANPKSKVTSVQQLLQIARAEPNKLTWASSGVGTGGWLSGQLLQQMAHISLLEIPYKGAGASTAAVVEGHTDLQFTDVGAAIPFIQAGQLKALGVSTKKRVAQLPDVPTLDEAGVTGYEIDATSGALAPAGTPPEIIKQIQHDISVAMHTKDVEEKLRARAYIPVASTPEEYAAQIQVELKKWGELIKATGIKPMGAS